MIRVRFAPSPTGYLHIGSARTALFNWLYARHHQGKFLLRIEDTDQERSTDANTTLIFHALKWMGIEWDEAPVIQSKQAQRHVEVAHTLLEKGCAYRCYCSVEELESMRNAALAQGLPPRYNGYWRDRDPAEAPDNTPYVIRFKMPKGQGVIVDDQVQGRVEMASDTLEDFVILRQDGTPTYMLAVVVDDHDMGITHIIRGDDHLTNTFKQKLLYDSLGWPFPVVAHIPLIHGADGAKLSKRHGAVGVDMYESMGILPEALCNYLLRLGWSHGNDEIIAREKAIAWFDLDHIGKSPARFDMNKLLFLNAHYIKEADNTWLAQHIYTGADDRIKQRLIHGMNGLKQRAKTLVELKQNAQFYITRPTVLSASAQSVAINYEMVQQFVSALTDQKDFSEDALQVLGKTFAQTHSIKLADLAQSLRILLTGHTISPSVFDIMAVLGREESIDRLCHR